MPPEEQQTRAFVVYFDRTVELKNAAVQITAELRRSGIKAEMSYGDRSRKAQMRQSNASGAAYAILIKEEELVDDLVTVKDLQAAGMDVEGKQVQVKRDALIEYLTNQ